MYPKSQCQDNAMESQMKLVPEPRRGHRSPGTGVLQGCKTPWRWLELNPDPPKEQVVLLTAEP